MDIDGSIIFNSSKICILKENDEITIPYNKNIYNKPFKVVINNNDNRSNKEIACIVEEVLERRK